MFRSITGYFSHDLAIDLGTANTLIYVTGRIVLDEPSVVSIMHEERIHKIIRPLAWKRKNARPHAGSIQAIRPMKDGVIADFTVTEQMLKQFIRRSAQPVFSPARAS